MALYRIAAGKHYHRLPPLSTLPWLGRQAIERYVTFDDNCAYDSAPYNASDVNKLFGLSFGFGGVHHHSARFGWRWSNGDQCIELLAYVYNAGQRNWDEQLRFPVVAQVPLGQRMLLEIEYDAEGQAFLFRVYTEHGGFWGLKSVPVGVQLPRYGLTHGLYFGGALAAPHAMSVRIDRK